uniref:Uncharacterized protein n=1 Tax=Setaria italica TaxID=4555 RepID=K3ZGR4_SETIT
MSIILATRVGAAPAAGGLPAGSCSGNRSTGTCNTSGWRRIGA